MDSEKTRSRTRVLAARLSEPTRPSSCVYFKLIRKARTGAPVPPRRFSESMFHANDKR